MSVPGPVLGPCESWINGADVALCCDVTSDDQEVLNRLERFAVEASMALFEISGRQFTGLCGPTTVRPCERCGCWVDDRVAASTVYWSDYYWAGGSPGGRGFCEPTSQVRLAGYPIREITEVKIDGTVVDPTTYRLDGWRYLVRLDDPGPPVVRRRWPGCQNLSLPDTAAGTFSVSYRWGVDPPPLGMDAAAALACQLAGQCGIGSANCQLPRGATKVTRQGVTVDRSLLINWLDPKKPTGILPLDLFLASSWPHETAGRAGAVWSPDVSPFPLRTT